MNQPNNLISGLAEINGAQLYYEMQGQGQPLLLIHAGVADCRMWDAQFEAFSQHYQVIRFDLRGFGRSTMPSGQFANYEDIHALLDFLKINTVYIVGVSFGGLIALDFTLAYPTYVKALILGAPSVSGAKPSERIEKFWEAEEALLENGDLEEATELNLKLWVDGPHRTTIEVSSVVRAQVEAMQLAIFKKEIPDDIDEIELEPPAIERLSELNIPVQVMVGTLDLAEKITLVDRLVDEIPESRKILIPDVAHMLNMEKPDSFNKHVLDFLATV